MDLELVEETKDQQMSFHQHLVKMLQLEESKAKHKIVAHLRTKELHFKISKGETRHLQVLKVELRGSNLNKWVCHSCNQIISSTSPSSKMLKTK